SQNARGYTGLLFGTLLATSLFIRLLATVNPPTRIILGYAVTAALAAWIQLTAVVFIFAHALIWIALAINSLCARRITASTPSFLALVLTVSFTLALYTPMFYAEHVEHILIGDGTSGFVEKSQATQWVVEEFTQGLKQAMPGGWPIVLVVIAALLAGISSYARQCIYVMSLLVLPSLATILLFTGMGQLFFPRFIICSAGFLLLIGVRGGFRLVELVLPFLSPRQILYVGMLFALASASRVPAAWEPKQDFAAAAEFIDQIRRPGDAVVCFSQTSFPLAPFHGMDCENPLSLAQLVRIENQHERTWLLYTLPAQAARIWPEIWSRVNTQSEYKLIREFKGTLHDGTVSVMLKTKSRN
ncbi:MAG: hypothetical protein ACREO9_07190, partial [Lysobacterales bacterium]